jgi:hypothetical protein
MRRILTAVILAASTLLVPAAAEAAYAAPTPADATMAVGHAHALASAACTYRRVGQSWKCITPGAYCPKAAHLKIGYAKVTGKRYRCSRYANGQWRWKRA